jgi:hypothetical protein
MARSRRRFWSPRITASRRYRGTRLGTLLLVALILIGLGFIAKDQGWVRISPGGKITILHITLGKPPVTAVQAPPKATAGHCNQALWAHVWSPQRLEVLAPCRTVTGVIDLIRLPEPDGDDHINIRLDPGQQRLIHRPGVQPGSPEDYTNTRLQHGDLVTEAICQHRVIQPDATSACAGLHGTIRIPPVGTHVEVTGVYVFDKDHGWTEIHPISIINRTG